MNKFLHLALKNVFRNRRRTVITGLVLVVGSAALILAGGFMGFSFRGLRESTISGQLGHLQVYHHEFFTRDEIHPLELGLDSVAELQRRIQTDPRVRFTMARVEMTGLLSNGEKSAVFVGRGVEPALEQRLAGRTVDMRTGTFLRTDSVAGTDPEIVVAIGLARSLNVREGSILTIMSTTAKGALNALDVRVAGTYSTGIPEYDERGIMVTLPTAQQLLNTHRVSKLVVVLDNTDHTAAVEQWLQATIPGIATRRWDQLATFYTSVVQLYSTIFLFLGVLVFIVVVLSCSNTMMMSIFERTREIGTQLAVGTSRLRILRNFLYEGLVIGVLGGALGLAAAFLTGWAVNALDIVMPPAPGRTGGYPLHIDFLPGLFLGVFFFVILMTVIATTIPAVKASRLRIVDALGHI